MIRVAAVQFAPKHREVAANVARICEMILATDADLIVFPELSLSGYFFRSAEDALPFAVEVESKEIDQMQEAARSVGRAVVVGFAELSSGVLYNSSILIDASGVIVGKYRKVHLFYFENEVFKSGDLGFASFEITCAAEQCRIGMMICYDWRFPEAARSLVLNGADLIVCPSNIVTTTGMLHTTLQVRAFENKVPIVFADRVGHEWYHDESDGDERLTFRGESAIINYNGEVLSQASKTSEEIIVSAVDLGPVRSKSFNRFNDIIGDRKPGSYTLRTDKQG